MKIHANDPYAMYLLPKIGGKDQIAIVEIDFDAHTYTRYVQEADGNPKMTISGLPETETVPYNTDDFKVYWDGPEGEMPEEWKGIVEPLPITPNA